MTAERHQGAGLPGSAGGDTDSGADLDAGSDNVAFLKNRRFAGDDLDA